MIEFLVWLAFLFFPGLAIGEFFALWRKDDPLSIRVAWTFGIGMSFNVALFFLRNFVPLGVLDTTLLSAALASVLLSFSLATRRRFSFPKMPTKTDFAMLHLLLTISAIVFLPFAKFPIFPQFGSVDFQSHVRIIQSYASGNMPALDGQLLYYGYAYLLSPLLAMGNGEPLVLTRQGMAVLVALSPLSVYLVSHRLFNSAKKALSCVIVWVFGGVWFGVVFNSGLYPNFYSILSSFWLVAISIRFMKDTGFAQVNITVNGERKFAFDALWLSRFPILVILILNALLSHFTILFTFLLLPAVLFVYGLRHQVLKRGVILLAAFAAPIGIGLALFPQTIPHLFFFLSGSGIPPRPTFLSSLVPFPVLSYMVAEITNDWLSIFLLASLAVYSYLLLRRKGNIMMLIPLALFVLVVTLSPLNTVAWRFAFVALMPLTFIGGYCLSEILPSNYSIKHDYGYGRTLRAVGFFALVLFPIFLPNSWSATSVGSSLTDTSTVADSDMADLKAIRWIQTNIPPSEKLMSVTDSRFGFSELLDVRKIYYAPQERVNGSAFVWNDPSQAGVFAGRNNITYLIVTKVITENLGRCPDNFGVTLRANATSVRPGGRVSFDIQQSSKADLPGALVINDEVVIVETVNGAQNMVIQFNEGPTKEFSVFAIFGSASTERMTVSVSDGYGASAQVGLPSDYCWPWYSFNPYTLRVATVYQDDYVKILRLGG